MLLCSFFFFKQKTAYEMRISDWSSDVCSSDLGREDQGPGQGRSRPSGRRHHAGEGRAGARRGSRGGSARLGASGRPQRSRLPCRRSVARTPGGDAQRSEEHTSELQSLMRISYAVFCLKKKTPYTKLNRVTQSRN